jgi:2-methylcitrate dehydratase PrpD
MKEKAYHDSSYNSGSKRMETEKKLVNYIMDTKFNELPRDSISIVKNMILTVLGTTVAGATAEGCDALVEFLRVEGGKEEATILIHGGKIPAQNAVFINSVMARALDFCDAMAPGLHIGSSAVPSAFAAAELMGGCSGKDFINAIVLGTEVAARLNLSRSAYDGFDPTGVCGVFASTVVASKLLGLNFAETWNALGLAFNRCGGSFQSNIDGSLAVRVIQGWVSQAGITCAQLSRLGVTGPKNFLEGIYGYFHLFAKDVFDPEIVAGDLGERFELKKLAFKKYPSCGATLVSTYAILSLIEEKDFSPEDINRIDIAVRPYTYKLAGHLFEIGDNPRVNAQFSIQYCIANALLRKSSKLCHFEELYVTDPNIMELVKKIHVTADPALEKRGDTSVDMKVVTSKGDAYFKSMDSAPGFSGNPLSEQEQEEHFWDCIDFAKKSLPRENAEKIISLVRNLEELEDVRVLIPLLLI